MNNDFVEVACSLKKDELVKLLETFNSFPESKKSSNKKYFENFSDWYNNVEYYSDILSKFQLQEKIIYKIKSAYKCNKEDISLITGKIVRSVAKDFKVNFDERMSNRDIENEILRAESDLMYAVYDLSVKCINYMAQIDNNEFDDIQMKVAQSLIDSLIITKKHRERLISITENKVELKKIEQLVKIVNKNKKLNSKAVFASILGFVWIIALTDDALTRNEIAAFNTLVKLFNIREKEANKLKSKTEENFDKLKVEIENELKNKGNVFNDVAIKQAVAGMAGAFTVLGLAEAAGFGLFLFATTTLKAIGLLFGVTFSFGTYTALTTILGLITGPIGWVGLPLVIVGGMAVKHIICKPDLCNLHQVILKCAMIRGDV